VAAIGIMVLAFVILAVLIQLLPPWPKDDTGARGRPAARGTA
jgi:hypothetical protein